MVAVLLSLVLGVVVVERAAKVKLSKSIKTQKQSVFVGVHTINAFGPHVRLVKGPVGRAVELQNWLTVPVVLKHMSFRAGEGDFRFRRNSRIEV